MPRVHVHGTADLPAIKAHRGIWSLPLPDGTWLHSVAHDDEPVARHELAKHPAVKHVLPSHRSGTAPHAETIAGLRAFIARQPTAAAGPLPPNPGTRDLLTALYAVTDDPIWSPEAD